MEMEPTGTGTAKYYNRQNFQSLRPKREAKGVDICGTEKKHYIIRSDLGCYMESTDLHRGKDLHVYSLHPSCQDGDHYLADNNENFYIIKGDKFRRVSDLSKDANAEVFDLHLKGDHYLFAKKKFYIVNQTLGKFYKTPKLENTSESPSCEFKDLPNSVKDGLYYWGTKTEIYFVRPRDVWGIHFQTTKQLSQVSLNKYANGQKFSFHPSVLNFLPGGLTETHGPVYERWELIKTISNDSKTAVKWDKKITQKVGYTKSKTSSIEDSWKVNITGKLSINLTKLILQSELSMSEENNCKSTNTDGENWEVVTDEEQMVSVTLEPKSKMYAWQYQLGFGKECVLFSRDIRFTDDPTPPV